MNRYPLQPRPQRWEARLSPLVIRLTRALRRRRAATRERLIGVEVHGAEIVREAVQRGQGVLITPNHPGHADAYIMFEAADAAGTPFYFMSAWQVFALQGPVGRWLLTRHGCFSVDREGADKEAFRTAVEIVRAKREPLVVFPEGEVYHQNDRVTPFREGAAAIALSAAKKATREIVAIPCAIRYRYVQDPMPQMLDLMSRLEEKVLWRPRPDLPLPQRIYRFAEALLALKEIEHVGQTQEGTLPLRTTMLADHVLRGIEGRYGLASPAGGSNLAGSVPVRIKEARAAALKRLAELDEGGAPPRETASGSLPEDASGDPRARIAHVLDDLFLVLQAFSYPGDYVDERPTVERLAETLDKFEEDVLGATTATVRADRRATVTFGEPIAAGGAGSDAGRVRAGDLTAALEEAVQSLLDAGG